MIDFCTHLLNYRSLPVAALLRQRGAAPWLAELLTRTIERQAASRSPLRLPVSAQEETERPHRLAATQQLLVAPETLGPGEAIDWVVDRVPESVIASADFPRLLATAGPWTASQIQVPVELREEPAARLRATVRHRRALLRELVASLGEPPHTIGTLLQQLHRFRADESLLFAEAGRSGAPEDVLVHHMVDGEYALGDAPRFPFRSQIDASLELCQLAAGRLLSFVAFDPFRPLGIENVRDALDRGCAGVSLYPAMGFRPFHNEAPLVNSDDPRVVDGRLLELYRELKRRKRPLVVFCGRGPFGSGTSNPEDWEPVLSGLARGRLRDLRLCLVVDAGEEPEWLHETPGRLSKPAFGETALGRIAALTKFPNVFVCFAGLAGLHRKAVRDRFGAWLRLAARHDKSFPKRWLYGSGFPQTQGRDPREERRHLEAFFNKSRALRPFRDGLLEGNASRFLSLPAFCKRHREALGIPSAQERRATERRAAPLAPPRLRAHRPRRLATRATRKKASRRRTTAAPASDTAASATELWDCVVIGAGIAGMTAARDLRAAGRSVFVLEASGRVGGRMQSRHQLGNSGVDRPVELGAELIHVPPEHKEPGPMGRIIRPPIWDEIDALPPLRTISIEKFECPCDRIEVYFEDWEDGFSGRRTGSESDDNDDFHAGRKTLEEVRRFGADDDLPEVDFIEDELGGRADHYVAFQTADMVLASTASGEPEELSVSGLRYDNLENMLQAEEEYHVAEGIDAIPKRMQTDFPVVFDTRVKRIAWSDQRVDLTVVQNGGEFLYSAKTAICTLPIGVLLQPVGAPHEVVFDPPLPATKTDALDQMGVETLSKIVLVFKQRFWDRKLAILNTPDEDAPAALYFATHFGRSGGGRVLTALLTRGAAAALDEAMGSAAEAGMENASATLRAFLRDEILTHLASMFGDELPQGLGLDDLAYFYCRSWTNDPFAYGGTSFIRYTGARRDEVKGLRRNLAAPDTGALFWAGEATALELQPWSIHGAHISGTRAAKETDRFL